MQFIPNTKDVEKIMFREIGVDKFADLIDIIPSHLHLKNDLGIGEPLSEIELDRDLQKISDLNNSKSKCFAGGGTYDHFIPKVVNQISGRSEFYTAYTPYQAEVSQGTLQYLYEFQTMICELSGMDIANASLYDAASALAEACLLALSVNKNDTIMYSSLINENYIHVMKTYLSGRNINYIEISNDAGITDLSKIKSYKQNIAAVIIQSPNKYGLIENWIEAKNNIINLETLFITIADPLSLTLLEPPGACGADIYVGEGQSLGNQMNYGGPMLGLMAVKDQYKRQMPGRIVGKTIDKNNKTGFVLTLQTREQHIRREKATSNICTNQGLLALRATVYLALLGKKGLQYIANLCFSKAQYTANKISRLDNYSLQYSNLFIKEFIINTIHPASEVIKYCADKGLTISSVDGDKSNSLLLIAVTEKRTKNDIDLLVKCLGEFH